MSECVLCVVCCTPEAAGGGVRATPQTVTSVQGHLGHTLLLRPLVQVPTPIQLCPWPKTGHGEAVACSARARAWDSNSTYRMNSVLISCGPASPICAAHRDGVAMAAHHCSRTVVSHN